MNSMPNVDLFAASNTSLCVINYACIDVNYARFSSNSEANSKANYQKILKKCCLGTTCIVICLACLSLQPHHDVLPLKESIKQNSCQFLQLNKPCSSKHIMNIAIFC